VEVPDWIIERPREITPAAILKERNAEVRRCMLERFGTERYLLEAGARLLRQDDCGKLWRTLSFTIAEVENGTVEPDGTRRRYFLQVPPDLRSPREAVAWTYGLTTEQYELAVRT
jgi:hypothetical protein